MKTKNLNEWKINDYDKFNNGYKVASMGSAKESDILEGVPLGFYSFDVAKGLCLINRINS